MAIVVKIGPDGMGATVDIDRNGDEAVLVESVLHALAEAGVTCGVDAVACNEIVSAINQQPSVRTISRTVARGTPPIQGEAGNLELVVEYKRNTVGLPGEFGSIDFHERGSYTPIAMGQLIANIKLPTAGSPGKDVRGNEIPTTPGERARFTAGHGTKLEAGGTELRATRHGDLRCSGDVIEVMDIIKVAGNLDYSAGSIECDGPVRIEGDVLPGFHIRAGGDVFVGGIVDAAEITTRGSLVVGQGVLGGSRICVNGKVTLGYVRESYLECDGPIAILKEAVNSTVVSGESITIPGNARVVGGRLFARNRIEVGTAGSAKGIPTTLAAGVNPLKELRAAMLASEIHRADTVQKRIGKLKNMASPDQHAVLDHILSLASAKRDDHAEELEALQAGEINAENCRVQVKNEIHTGVRICIGKGEMTMKEERRNATFYYDVGSGQVVQVSKG